MPVGQEFSQKRPAVLLLHRAAGDRSENNPLATLLSEQGVASLALDFRGYGDSTNFGKFEEPYRENRHINQGAYQDTNAALMWIMARDPVDPARLAVVGASL